MPQLLGPFLSTTVAANPGVSVQTNLKQGETNSDSRDKSLVLGDSGSRNKQMHRSGTRVPCQIRAKLTSLDPTHPFADSCLVILANPQGCAAHFRRPVKIGTAVKLEGLPSSSSVTAQVVNCISLGEHQKSWLLGLALTEPGNVWGVEAPPEDWAS
jgi:hypothetical protein